MKNRYFENNRVWRLSLRAMFLVLFVFIAVSVSRAQTFTQVIYSTAGIQTWTKPVGVTAVKVECWGSGGTCGNAGATGATSRSRSGGSAGGSYARRNIYNVASSSTVTLGVGASPVVISGDLKRANGKSSWFGDSTFLKAQGGQGGESRVTNTTDAIGQKGVGDKSNSFGDATWKGGDGYQCTPGDFTINIAAGGGSSAGPDSDGVSATGYLGAIAPLGGGNGSNSVNAFVTSANLNLPGFGGGGGGTARQNGGGVTGSKGGVGKVIITIPTVFSSVSTLTGFHYTAGDLTSSSVSCTISAGLITATSTITVTGSSNFEVSKDNITFSSSISYSVDASSSLASTTIYIKLKAGLPFADYNENIVVTADYAAPLNIACTGKVFDNVTVITLDKYTSTDFITYVGFKSISAQTFIVSGNLLTPTIGEITVTGTSNYLVSTNTIDYVSSLTLSYTGGVLSPTSIYIKSFGVSDGVFKDNVSISGGGATTVNIACSGTVYLYTPLNASIADFVGVAGTNTMCNSQGATATVVLNGSASGGTGNYTYSWTMGDNTSAGATSTTVSKSVTTDAQIATWTITVNDGYNTASSSIFINLLNPTPIFTPVSCDANNIVVSVQNIPGATYSWYQSLASSTIVGTSNTQTIDRSLLTSTYIEYTATLYNSICSSSATKTVKQNFRDNKSTPITGISSTVTYVGGTLTITPTFTTPPAVLYLSWTSPDNSVVVPATQTTAGAGRMYNQANVSLAASGTYTLTVTENSGCTYSSSTIVPIDYIKVYPVAGANGTVTPSATQDVVYAGSTTITAIPNTGAYFVNWTGATGTTSFDGTSSSITITNITAIKTVTANFALNQYAVSASSTLGGTVTSATQLVTYGASVTLEAIPNAANGYKFKNWTFNGVEVSTSAIYEIGNITATPTYEYVANFELKPFMVTAIAAANGTVSPSTQTLTYGATATVIATPNSGYKFVDWKGSISGTIVSTEATYTLVVAGDTSITASFIDENAATFPVIIIANSNGTIDGVASKTFDILPGSSTPLITATPATGYHFDSWTGDIASATIIANTAKVENVTASITLTANFVINTYNVSTSSVGSGTVDVSSSTVNHGGSITLTAIPSSDAYQFIGWLGAASGTTNPITISDVSNDISATATFQMKTYNVTTATTGSGTITVSSSPVNYGGSVTLTATASAGYQFVGWLGDVSGTSNTITISDIKNNISATATFVKVFTVTLVAGSGGNIVGSTKTTVIEGGNVAIEASQNLGSTFSSWTLSNGVSSTLIAYTISNVTENITATASFVVQTFTVTTYADPAFASVPSPTQIVNYGATVTIRVNPLSGFSVSSWDGIVGGSSSIVVITNVTNNISATATLAVSKYTISTSVVGGGTVVTPTQIIDHGTTVTLEAIPFPGATFINWTSGTTIVSTSSIYTLSAASVTTNINLTATFSALNLTISALSNISSAGSITVSPSNTIVYGGSVTLSTTPTIKYNFVSWSWSDGVTTTVSTSTITTISPVITRITATATFALKTIVVTATAGVGGTVSTPTQLINYESNATITAIPDIGYKFVGWTGDVTSTLPTISFANVIAPKSVVANFTIEDVVIIPTITVTSSASPSIGGKVATETQVVAVGATVTIKAIANPGYKFIGWTGDVVSVFNPLILNVSATKTYVANFAPLPNSVSLQSFETLKVYPTIVSDVLNIENSTTILSIVIVSMNSNIVVSQKVDAFESRINVSSLNSGTYFVKVITKEGVKTRKIIVVK